MKRTLAIILSVILMASHMYLTIGTHFCGGVANNSEIILAKSVIDCGMSSIKSDCQNEHKSENPNDLINSVPCCEDRYQNIQTTDDFVKDVQQVILNFDFIVFYLYTSISTNHFPKQAENLFAYKSPPLIEKDVQVLFQSFLN